MMKRLLWVLLPLLVGQALAAGKIYTWTDDDGNVHYGDRPPQNVQAEEITMQGSGKAETVEVDQAQLVGTWFGETDEGGQIRMNIERNGNIRYTQTFANQSIYNYQGIWQLDDRSMQVITEFVEEGGGNTGLQRSVEPVQLSYTFLNFTPQQLTMVFEGETYQLEKVR